jgi:hypothetical protein
MKDNKTWDELLDEVDKSIASDQLFQEGTIVDDSGEYEQYYSDSPGGCYYRMRIVKHNEKHFVYKERIEIAHDLSEKKECVAFYELK